MKRLLIFKAFLILTTVGYSQTGQVTGQAAGSQFFGQCMLDLSSEEQYVALENSLRQNPNVAVVRLDRPTHRAFLLTNTISSLTEEGFRSWFGEYGSNINCIQVGKQGYDQVQPYPFTNCSDN